MTDIGTSASTTTSRTGSLAILGGGNLGRALALGWVKAGLFPAGALHVTRRRIDKIADLADEGFVTGKDNAEAVRNSTTVVLAVQPQQLDDLLAEIATELEPGRHRVVSVVSGALIAQIREAIGPDIPIVRAMPNTAVSIGESMTCLSADAESRDALAGAEQLFQAVGETLVIREEMMVPATALCACGVAFFLRCIRAASQGGIEIGFHPEEALLLAGQTARGAAALSLKADTHPEEEIDRVTTPRGCTIAGLNEMEHQGLSSALIKGFTVSAKAAADLYRD